MSVKLSTRTKFKVGDRVRYYGAFNEYVDVAKATVVEVCENGILRVETDEEVLHVHPKQCRKLKPKKKPLRIEGTCSWRRDKRDTGGWAVPWGDEGESELYNHNFAQFIGKRTKITVEVIDD